MASLVLLATFTAVAITVVPVGADNAPPVAMISSPDDGSSFMVSEVVVFDGSQSEDEDPTNLTYEWDFGGETVSGKDKAVVQRSFTTPGEVLVILRVIDPGGRDDTTFITIDIIALNSPPVAIISAPEDGARFLSGRSITFDGRESYDPDGGPLVYRWETNRTIDPIGNEAMFSITLPLGRYRVTLFVFDQVGAEGHVMMDVTVEINVPPTLSKGTVEPRVGPHDIGGGFNFSVTYQDVDGDLPEDIRVKVGLPGNLIGYHLAPSDPGDGDVRDGKRYHALVPLGPGHHDFVFVARDLFYSCATVLYHGPEVYEIELVSNPSLGATTTVNWTEVGYVVMRATPPPGPGPVDTVIISQPVDVAIEEGIWSEAQLRLRYSTDYPVDVNTITLLWYDAVRGLWVPASGQHHDREGQTVEGQIPGGEAVMAVFGVLNETDVNTPPNLAIRYDKKDAYVNEVLWFDATCSTDPDATLNLFYWDFTDDGRPGPWVPGLYAYHVFDEKGTHEVGLMAIDGGNRHYLYENVSIRAEREYTPGPWDNPGALFLLASLLVIAFGLAVAYRLRKPKTYDDLFGKAYAPTDDDEYSQLFRKLTEEDIMGDLEDEPGDLEDPEDLKDLEEDEVDIDEEDPPDPEDEGEEEEEEDEQEEQEEQEEGEEEEEEDEKGP